MPWKVEKDTNACPVDRPFAVKNSNTGSVNGRCHATQASAEKQKRLLYAKMNRGEIKMSEHSFLIAAKKFSEGTTDGNIVWIQAYPYDSWDHPLWGVTTITPEIAQEFVKNFHENIRGHDLAVGYEHGLDNAKGSKAGGWIREMEARDDGLYFGVELTSTAKEEIQNGEWKYFSTEHYDEWTHPHTKETYEYVISGGTLTNSPWVKGMAPINFSEFVVEKMEGGKVEEEGKPKGESKEMEHSEPGTGTPPEPRKDEDGSDDKSITSGSRRDTPPIANEPEDSMDLDAKIREKLGLDKDADIIKAVSDLHDEVKPLREAAKAHSERKAFAEMFPGEAADLERLRKKNRENEAKAFSERYSRIVKKEGEGDNAREIRTTHGFSGLALQKIEETHKKFSEGSATIADLADILDAVAAAGLVDYGERGSTISGSDFTGSADPVKAFAEKVAEIRDKDELEHGDAVTRAAKLHPDLFKAYDDTMRSRR